MNNTPAPRQYVPGRVPTERVLSGRLFARLTIAGKMFAGYAVLTVLILTVVVYVLVSLFRINSLNQAVLTIDVPVQVAIDRMIDSLLAQDLYEKRYRILRRKDLRHLFWERAKEFDARFEELRTLPGDAPFSLGAISKLHARYGDLFLDVVREVQRGRGDRAATIANGPMREALEGLLELLRRETPRARASQDARMREISKASDTAFRTTVLLCVLSSVVGACAGLLITWYISSSIGKLTTATRRISEGNFESPPGIRAEDEIGELAKAFVDMGLRLKKMEEMYLDASPLTRLPGGIAIERETQKRLDRGTPTAFCVMDLDNFKAFNDRYGYARGNVVIKETARIVEQASRTHGAPDDFIGHVGGDDFVVVTDPGRMHELCGEIIARFDRSIPLLYDPGDQEKGYIWGRTRQGVEMKFPLMTISIAIVTNIHRTLTSALEASELAAELKDYAKTFNRSLYVVDKRRT
ncbi:MAG TPA: diguanylate cyclase [Nitrospirota bacterium]|nr:diguanylate cyclase [Nitrospirota bacterium]